MRLFISYRTEDKGFVGRMRLYLQEHLPELEVKQSNTHGKIETIDSVIKNIDILLVVIGPSWLRLIKESTSFPNSHDDNVHSELIVALKYPHIRIAPLLVDDAKMPGKQDMPSELIAFATINAATINNASFENDIMQVVEMIKSPGDESSWFPSVKYGTIQIRSKEGGFVNRYMETEFTPVILIIDNEEVGTMQLINKTFEQKVIPGEHIVALKSGDITGIICECRVLVKPGQVYVLNAERNPFWGKISLKSAN